MKNPNEYIQSEFPDLDIDAIEYIMSIAEDNSIDEPEKSDLICEYISSTLDSSDDISNRVNSFLSIVVECGRTKSKRTIDLDSLTNTAFGQCLNVIKAPIVVNVQEPTTPVDEDELRRKKELLKMYDPESHHGKSIPVQDDEEDEIYGLGANENRLRKIREREEERAQAKREQEEIKEKRIQEKLKRQGEGLKSKTVVRSSKRN
jgi:hypothetical protein